MRVTPLDLGVLLVHAPTFRDDRGAFSITYQHQALAQVGFERAFIQDNLAMSHKAATLRGLHFQAPPHAQDKLISVLAGAVFDVAVDIRKSSPSFGRWVGRTLSADNGEQLLIPAGFAHGYLTLTDHALVAYKVSGDYAPDCEGGLLWNDPALGIDWPLDRLDVTINDRDAAYPTLADLDTPF